MTSPGDHDRATLPGDLRRRMLTALGKDEASALLARIAYWLALTARNDYSEAGSEPTEAYERLRTHNERLIVLTGQLRKLAGDKGFGYPDDAFLDSLAGKPGGNRAAVGQALQKALDGE